MISKICTTGAGYTSTLEIDRSPTSGRIAVNVRNMRENEVIEEGAIMVELTSLITALNTALEGSGEHVTHWREVA